jgi:hypothetical protein
VSPRQTAHRCRPGSPAPEAPGQTRLASLP